MLSASSRWELSSRAGRFTASSAPARSLCRRQLQPIRSDRLQFRLGRLGLSTRGSRRLRDFAASGPTGEAICALFIELDGDRRHGNTSILPCHSDLASAGNPPIDDAVGGAVNVCGRRCNPVQGATASLAFTATLAFVESATCRLQRTRKSPNPTLSAKLCRLDSIIYKRLRNSRYNAVWRLHSLGLMMEAPTPNCADPLP
jgi:hypothetical protein